MLSRHRTTGRRSRQRTFIVASSRFRCPCTRSGGVNAIQLFRDTSDDERSERRLRKIGDVDLLDRSAIISDGRVFRSMKREGARGRAVGQLRPHDIQGRGHGHAEDIFLRFRDVLEALRRHTEVFRENALWRMGHVLSDQQRLVLGEAAVIKDEEEFAAAVQA